MWLVSTVMNDFLTRLEKVIPHGEELILSWLGQAGFLIKTAKGKLIVIDPCLSDYTYRINQKEHGQMFRRVAPPLCDPCQINADMLFISHEHADHCEIDSLPGLLINPESLCYTNSASIKEAASNNIPTDKFHEIKRGGIINFDEFKFSAVDCDHGTQSPEAMGFIFDFGFVSVYYSGDTSYNKERLADVITRGVDVALLPINGAFGNLNAQDAARYAGDLGAKLCIPHHFWTFPGHEGPLGNPKDAIEFFPKYAPGCILRLCTPGELILIGRNGTCNL